MISGTAAAGAPIIGTITVKDALGATRSVAIADADNGKFSINVAGMTAPFVFRATGSAAGETWTVYAPASSADAGGTINVTPFTDLILANVAGQLASAYFDSGNFAAMTKTDIDAEAAKLRERLLPILTALGINGAVDLLRTPFTPLADQLDKVLDVVRVSYDTAGTTATLTNIITSQAITDSLATKAAAETSAPVMTDTSNVATGSDDIPAITAAVKAYSDMFATALPTTSQITAKLTSGFVAWDMSRDQFAAAESTESFYLGRKFSNIEVTSIDYANVNGVTAKVSFTMTDANGVVMQRQRNFRVRKSGSNWLLHGDRQCVSMKVVAHMGRNNNGQNLNSGLEFQIEDVNPGNCGTGKNITPAYAIVNGPGLPSGGLKYIAPALGGEYYLDGGSSGFYNMVNRFNSGSGSVVNPDMSSLILSIPDSANYNVTLYDSSNAKIVDATNSNDGINYGDGIAYAGDVIRLPKRPLTLGELDAEAASSTSRFPVINAPTFAQLSAYSGGAMTISVSNMNPQHFGWVFLRYTTASSEERDEADVAPSSAGAFSKTFTLNTTAPGNITLREIRVENTIDSNRSFMTTYNATP